MTHPFQVLWSSGTHVVVAVLQTPAVHVPGVAVHVAAVQVPVHPRFHHSLLAVVLRRVLRLVQALLPVQLL